MTDPTQPTERQDQDEIEPAAEPEPAQPAAVVDEPVVAAVTTTEPVEPVIAEPVVAAVAPTEPDETVVVAERVEPVATIVGGAESVPVVAAVAEPTERRRRGPAERPAPKPLAAYAVVETGGKQYRVSVGDSLAVEKLAIEAGSELTFDRVLLLGGDGTTRVGTPEVAGAAVTARVDDHFRGEKIIVFKYKPKKRYRRRLGHRQSLTRLTITGITG